MVNIVPNPVMRRLVYFLKIKKSFPDRKDNTHVVLMRWCDVRQYAPWHFKSHNNLNKDGKPLAASYNTETAGKQVIAQKQAKSTVIQIPVRSRSRTSSLSSCSQGL